MFSGLVECPCTDAYPKKLTSAKSLNTGTCKTLVPTASDCFADAAQIGLTPVISNTSASSTTLPAGCSAVAVSGGFEVTYNAAAAGSAVQCGQIAAGTALALAPRSVGSAASAIDLTIDLTPVPSAPATSLAGSFSGVGQPYEAAVTANADGTLTAECVCTDDSCVVWPTATGTVSGSTLNIFQGVPGAVSADLNTITFSNGLVWVRSPNGTATITLSGPAGVWFGVGFGASSAGGGMVSGLTMKDTPWTIVVAGNSGQVEERALGDHEEGSVLAPTVAVQSNTVVGGRRTVVLTRPMRTGVFNLNSWTSTLSFINAFGTSPAFSYHGVNHASGTMYFFDLDGPTCICSSEDNQGTIGGFAWGHENCLPKPAGDMLDDPKWASNGNVNPTCLLQSYTGGQRCCKGGSVLLDSDQQASVAPEKDQWQMKFRYYFEEVPDPSLANLTETFFLSWWTEQNNNEHDVPVCKAVDADCTHTITSNFTGAQLGGSQNFTLIHLESHCHIGCMSMELWIMDDPAHPELLCKTELEYGTGETALDEIGFILGAPPCIFGRAEDGFQPYRVLTPETKLMSVKISNNTVGHTGDMALWEFMAATV